MSSPVVEHGRSIGRNVFASSAAQTATMAFAVLSTIVTARWLGASGRGVLALVTTGASTAAIVLSFGAYQGLSTYSARRELSLRFAVVATAAFASLAAAVAFASVNAFEPRMGAADALVRLYVPLGAAAVVLGLCQVALATGTGRLDISARNTVTTAALLTAGYGVAWAVGLEGAAAVTTACVVWLGAQLVGDLVGWLPIPVLLRGRATTAVRLGDFLGYSLRAYPSAIVGQLNARVDLLLLGAMASAASVGVYSTAVVASSVLLVVPSAVGAALTRPFGDSTHDDAGRLARVGAIGSVISTAVTGPVLVLLLVWLGPAVLGPDFAAVGLLVAVLVPGVTLFASAYAAASFYGTALRRPLISTYVASAALVTDLVLLSILAPRFGALGAAVASSVGYAVGGLVNAYALWSLSSPDGRLSPGELRSEFAEAIDRLAQAARKVAGR